MNRPKHSAPSVDTGSAPVTGARGAVAAAPKRIVSIRWIVTSAAVLLTAATALSVGAVAERNARSALTGEIESRLLLLARNLALTSSGALLEDFPELTLQPLVKETVAHEPGLAFVIVVDHRNQIQGHADARQLGTSFEPPPGLRAITPEHPLEAGESLAANPGLIVASTTIPNPSGGTIGRALVGLNRDYIERRVAASRRQQAVTLVLFVVLGVGAAFVLMSHLLHPVGVLRAGIERVGRGDLDTPIQLRDPTEFGLLAGAVNEMTGRLKHAQVELIERERLAHEVDLARQIQESLLPRGPVSAGHITVRGDHRAAAEVGGDYYDILPLPDGRIAIAIADVAGKGLAGCLVMSMLSVLLRALRNTYTSPAALLGDLDERLGESLRPGVFVTMFYGILDPATGRMVFTSAGHNPMILYRHSERCIEVLQPKGIPLAALRGGVARSMLCDEVVQLRPGDVMVQFTDGYSEAFDTAHTEEYGIERIQQVVAQAAPRGADAICDRLKEEVRQWEGSGPPSDDQTLLIATLAVDACELAAEVTATPDDPASVALKRLADAERAGHGLRLTASLDSVAVIRQWLRRTPVLSELSGEDAQLLGSALYEVCANVAEHGFGESGDHSFELWWQPPRSADTLNLPAQERTRRGVFVVRDDGTPFRPENWKGLDFDNPGVRQRGRGLGLEIIHRVMHEVAYHPATSRGNITLLTFGPHSAASLREG
jgi:serine phosphatase RsbU (regulator of sigma subunit)/anti-sigma regulatory factor (Ser/Thr protein kinase)